MSSRTKIFGSLLAIAGLGLATFLAFRARPIFQVHPSASIEIKSSATAASTNSQRATGSQDVRSELSALGEAPIVRAEQILAIAAIIPTAEIESVLNGLGEADLSPEVSGLRTELVRRWAETDAGGAAAWAERIGSPELRKEQTLQVATVWAGQNPSLAAHWVRQWSAEDQESGLLAVGFESARKSPETAAKLAMDLPQGENRDSLLRHAAGEWAVRDLSATSAWADSLQTSKLKNEVFANLAVALSEADPQKAAALALEKIAPGEDQEKAIAGVVQRWAQSAPSETAAWVLEFPEGDLRDASLHHVIQIWSQENPAETARWIENLPADSNRDQAITTFTRQIASSHPADAARWVEHIQDPVRREQELVQVAERWLLIDRETAMAWVQQSEIPPAIREELAKKTTEVKQF